MNNRKQNSPYLNRKREGITETRRPAHYSKRSTLITKSSLSQLRSCTFEICACSPCAHSKLPLCGDNKAKRLRIKAPCQLSNFKPVPTNVMQMHTTRAVTLFLHLAADVSNRLQFPSASSYFVTNVSNERKHSPGAESRKKSGKHFLPVPPVLLQRSLGQEFFPKFLSFFVLIGKAACDDGFIIWERKMENESRRRRSIAFRERIQRVLFF